MAASSPAILAAAVNAASAAIEAAGPLQGASLSTLAPVALAVKNALQAFSDAASAIDVQVVNTSCAGVIAGAPVPVSVAALLRQMYLVNQEAVVRFGQGYMGRLAANLADATG